MTLRGCHPHLFLIHLLIDGQLFDRKFVSAFKNVFPEARPSAKAWLESEH